MIKLLKQVPLAFFIAFRMARSKRSPTLSVVTLLSIGGIALGVPSLTVVLGVTGGFQEAFQERILGLYPHLVVHRSNSDIRNYEALVEDIAQADGVVAASPVTFDDMMLAAGAHRAGAVVKGLHLPTTDDVIGLLDLLLDGAKLSDLEENLRAEKRGQAVRISKPYVNTWNTVILHEEKAYWWIEDQTPPTSEASRVTLVDARSGAKSGRITMTWIDPLGNPGNGEELQLGTPSAPPPTLSIEAGTWKLKELNLELELYGEEFVTVFILQSSASDTPTLRIFRTPKRMPLGDSEAMIRCLRTDIDTNSMTLEADDGRVLGTIPPKGTSSFQSTQALLPGIVLGSALAKKLSAKVGDNLSLLTPLRGVDNQMVGPVGMMPSSARHRVTGIFESGFYDYDVRLAFVNIDASQRFLNRGKVVRWIEVKTENLLALEKQRSGEAAAIDPYEYKTLVTSSLLLEKHVQEAANRPWAQPHKGPKGFGESLNHDMQRLTMLKFQEENLGYHPEFRLMDWEELNQNLFSALKLQKVVLAMFFLIIILVGCFVVVGSQVMVIHDKTPDIAILKAMGAKKTEVGLIFAIQGLLVACIGIVIGLLGGLGICWGIHSIRLPAGPFNLSD